MDMQEPTVLKYLGGHSDTEQLLTLASPWHQRSFLRQNRLAGNSGPGMAAGLLHLGQKVELLAHLTKSAGKKK